MILKVRYSTFVAVRDLRKMNSGTVANIHRFKQAHVMVRTPTAQGILLF